MTVKRTMALGTGMLVAFLLCGCARMTVKTGKNVVDLTALERGRTTRVQVLQRYGPPQVLDPTTRTASFGENHLAYEERKGTGWYVMFYLPGYGIPLIGFFSANEAADTTVFLFDDRGTLVDFARSRGPVGKRTAFTFMCWVMSGMLIK